MDKIIFTIVIYILMFIPYIKLVFATKHFSNFGGLFSLLIMILFQAIHFTTLYLINEMYNGM